MTRTAGQHDDFPQLLRGDPSRAFALVQVQALAGDPASRLALGQMWLEGIGCERNAAEARYWFQQAAHQGESLAMNMLGRCLENGWGGDADQALAVVWYRESAEHGSAWGMYNYAQALAGGNGVQANRAQAFHWLTLAAQAGHGRAMHVLGQYYEHGWETSPDPARARELYRCSAAKGDYRGQCSWASVLAEQGHVDEACDLLRRVLATAPTSFVEEVQQQLRQSQHAQLRLLAKTLT